MSKVKNREEFEGGLEKRKGKGGKREKKIEKSDKTHVKIPLLSLNTAKNPQKQGRILEGGGGKNFSGWPEYIPLTRCH